MAPERVRGPCVVAQIQHRYAAELVPRLGRVLVALETLLLEIGRARVGDHHH